jgi:hypothetical protein
MVTGDYAAPPAENLRKNTAGGLLVTKSANR